MILGLRLTAYSSNLARTALVSDLTGVASRFSSTVTDDGVDNLTTLRSTSNSPNMENPPTGCMASVRSRLQTTGLSPEVCKILLASWRTSTQKRYEGPWHLWASWCLQRHKCPFSAAVADVLESYQNNLPRAILRIGRAVFTKLASLSCMTPLMNNSWAAYTWYLAL